MDRYVTIHETKQKFLSLVEEAEDGGEVIITKQGKPKAVIVNFEQLQTLKAVARLWQDPEALLAMRKSLHEVRAGKIVKLSGTPSVVKILTTARKKRILAWLITGSQDFSKNYSFSKNRQVTNIPKSLDDNVAAIVQNPNCPVESPAFTIRLPQVIFTRRALF